MGNRAGRTKREAERAAGTDRGPCGGIKRGVARREKRARRTAVWRKGREEEDGGSGGTRGDERREGRTEGNAGEKRLERKEGKRGDRARGREREREKHRDARERRGVEAAGFLSRHRRSHPTKIDSISLDSSVQRRTTRGEESAVFLAAFASRPGRQRRQRVSTVLVVLFVLLPFVFHLPPSVSPSRFSPRSCIPHVLRRSIVSRRKDKRER